MSQLELKVDGETITAQEGDTILEACERAGIEIPTLCHHSSLSDVGACRICSVDIEGSGFETACTTPVQDGLVIRTNTEELQEHRKTILELICAEENHYCMYCDQDGDCELQDLFKEYGVDHVSIPFSYKSYPVDAVSEHLVIDHNRCILCGRCIRACEEVVSNDTLDFGGRGQETKVVADLNQSLGESTCISCGLCQQVCPTGTIFSKHSAYRGNTKESVSTTSYCTNCSVGCGIDVFTRSNNLVQIRGNEIDGPSGGQLCEKGRFQPHMDGRERVDGPFFNSNGATEETTVSDALNQAAQKLSEASELAGMISSRVPLETGESFESLMDNYGGKFDVPGGRKRINQKRALEENGSFEGLYADSIEELLDADSVMVYDTSIVDTHPVPSAYIRKAAKSGCDLFCVDDQEDRFSRYSTEKFNLPKAKTPLTEFLLEGLEGEDSLGSREDKLQEAGLRADDLYAAGESLSGDGASFIVTGPRVDDRNSLAAIYQLAEKTGSKLLELSPICNQGMCELSLSSVDGKPDVAYLLASDDADLDEMVDLAERSEYVIVQAARKSKLTELADLVLPALPWIERKGTFVDIEGERKELARVLDPRISVESDREILEELK